MNEHDRIGIAFGSTMGALALLAAGCGNLTDPGGGASHVAYAPGGDIATFVAQALLVLDGQLERINARVSYVEPEPWL